MHFDPRTAPGSSFPRIEPPRPVGTDSALVAGALALALAVWMLDASLDLAFPAVAVAGLAYAVTAGLVAAHAGGARQPYFGAANSVTLVRAVLTAIVCGLVVETMPSGDADSRLGGVIAALAFVALLLDGADGWLARRWNSASNFGARFDMEVDALLILALSVAAVTLDKAGAFAVLIGAMRYLFVAAARIWRWIDAPLPPSFRRKAVCVLQAGILLLILLPLVPPALGGPAALLALAALTASFAEDLLWLHRHRTRGT